MNASSTTVCQKASQEGPWQFSLVYLPESCLGANEEAPHLFSRGWGGVGETEAIGGSVRQHPTTALMLESPGLTPAFLIIWCHWASMDHLRLRTPLTPTQSSFCFFSHYHGYQPLPDWRSCRGPTLDLPQDCKEGNRIPDRPCAIGLFLFQDFTTV